MQSLNNILAKYSFELELSLIVALFFLAKVILAKFFSFMQNKAKKTNIVWDDIIAYAIEKPAKIFILLITTTYLAEAVSNKLDINISAILTHVRELATIYAIAHFSLTFLNKLEDIYIEGAKASSDKATAINAIIKLVKVTVYLATSLIIVQSFGLNINGVLALGGVSGIAVGFAAKDLLANFFGALMIYLDKPFKIGDWVRSSDKEIEGIVEAIGWRQTRIRNFNKRPIYVPNSVFATIAVENPSRMSHRRIDERIGIRYDDFNKTKNIVNEIKEFILAHPKIDNEQILIVNFDRFADSALEIKVLCMVTETDSQIFSAVKEELLLKIGEIIENQQADIAYPTMTLKQIKA